MNRLVLLILYSRHKNVKNRNSVHRSNVSKILRSFMNIVAESEKSSRNEYDRLGVACKLVSPFRV